MVARKRLCLYTSRTPNTAVGASSTRCAALRSDAILRAQLSIHLEAGNKSNDPTGRRGVSSNATVSAVRRNDLIETHLYKSHFINRRPSLYSAGLLALDARSSSALARAATQRPGRLFKGYICVFGPISESSECVGRGSPGPERCATRPEPDFEFPRHVLMPHCCA